MTTQSASEPVKEKTVKKEKEEKKEKLVEETEKAPKVAETAPVAPPSTTISFGSITIDTSANDSKGGQKSLGTADSLKSTPVAPLSFGSFGEVNSPQSSTANVTPKQENKPVSASSAVNVTINAAVAAPTESTSKGDVLELDDSKPKGKMSFLDVSFPTY